MTDRQELAGRELIRCARSMAKGRFGIVARINHEFLNKAITEWDDANDEAAEEARIEAHIVEIVQRELSRPQTTKA